MGLEFKIIQSERKELDKAICDRCGVEIKKLSEGHWNEYGEPHSVYHEPGFDCFFFLEHSWGYFSNKDGQTHRAVLCEPCYDIVFKDVKIKVTNYL
jgi:hypothetical protein